MQPFWFLVHQSSKSKSMNMKKVFSIGLTILALAGGLQSCKDNCTLETVYDANVPVYLSFEELRQPATVVASSPLKKPAKFWRKDDYLFVSDLNAGIHIYNVANSNAPIEMAFVTVPGVVDIALKDNYLYADSYTDLLVLDISNPASPVEIKRVLDVFPYNPFKVQANEGFPVVAPDESKGVVIDWKIEKVTDEAACNGGASIFYTCPNCEVMNMGGGFLGNSAGPQTFSGGGSMAAFALMGNYLYTVDASTLHAYSIFDPLNPQKTSEQTVGWNIETIIAYERFLFLGSQTGLFIYGVNNPASPNFISAFSHATACDPVIVQDDIAYVTLRSGTNCQGNLNQLDVLNVENVNNPVLIRTYPMSGPYGLGIDGNVLAVCEAEFGVKVFNAADPANLVPLAGISSINVKDVIMYNGIALFIGDAGIFVFTYDSAGNFTPGGTIPYIL